MLAEKLEVEVNMLKNEGDGIEDIKVETNTVTYDRMHAAKLVKEVNALFAGGNLSEADKDAVMFALQEA